MTEQHDDEHVVLVDPRGTILGIAPKLASHHANTPLHLAFSLYIFNDKGDFLVTQRALQKKVWPGVWTNSCCGHLALGETTEQAIQRRAHYELGMQIKGLQVLFLDYRYATPPFKGIVENEICPIYIARSDSSIVLNKEEVADFQWVSWDKYVTDIQVNDDTLWSWWAQDQLKHIIDSKSASAIIADYCEPLK